MDGDKNEEVKNDFKKKVFSSISLCKIQYSNSIDFYKLDYFSSFPQG